MPGVHGYDRNTILWYRTRFSVPEQRGRLSLCFAEVEGWTEVCVNGRNIEVPAPADAKLSTSG